MNVLILRMFYLIDGFIMWLLKLFYAKVFFVILLECQLVEGVVYGL
jgi:hypothetical protein